MSADHPVIKAGTLLGSIVCWFFLAGIIVIALDLVTLAASAPSSAVQALNRSADVVVGFERQVRRSGAITSYQIRF
jgi:hypothetical protein